MENTSLNPHKTQEPNPEQLLKLIEMQVASARERRLAREAGRSKAGPIGLVIILAGAVFALWLLMMMLDQMRPQQAMGMENPDAPKIEAAR